MNLIYVVLFSLDLCEQSSQLPAEVAQCLTPLSAMVKVAAEDKIQQVSRTEHAQLVIDDSNSRFLYVQVLLSGITLLGDVLKSSRRFNYFHQNNFILAFFFFERILTVAEIFIVAESQSRSWSRSSIQLSHNL